MIWYVGECKDCDLEIWLRIPPLNRSNPVAFCSFCNSKVEMEKAGEALHVEGTSPARTDQLHNAVISIANSLQVVSDICERRYDPRDPEVW